MQPIYLATNKTVALTITAVNNLNQPFNPGSAPTVDIWQDNGDGTFTQKITAAAMTNFESVVGVYYYPWDISTANPGNYILIYNFYGVGQANPYTETDTVQLVNLSYMGSGGSALGYINLVDANTSAPVEGLVCWIQTTPTLGSPQSAPKISDSFGYVEFWAVPGTYYVWSPNYDTYIGTLTISATVLPVFTVNPSLTW